MEFAVVCGEKREWIAGFPAGEEAKAMARKMAVTQRGSSWRKPASREQGKASPAEIK